VNVLTLSWALRQTFGECFLLDLFWPLPYHRKRTEAVSRGGPLPERSSRSYVLSTSISSACFRNSRASVKQPVTKSAMIFRASPDSDFAAESCPSRGCIAAAKAPILSTLMLQIARDALQSVANCFRYTTDAE